MTRTLSAPTTTAVGLDVVSPGYLVEINFATPLRLSTRGTLTWNSLTWTTWDFDVRGLAADSSGSTQGGSLTLWNGDYTISALVLGEGVANRAVNVYQFYGESPALADPVHIFAGVVDDAQLEPTNATVTLRLVQTNARALFAPRHYITPDSGFSYLPAAGTVISWDGQQYHLAEE